MLLLLLLLLLFFKDTDLIKVEVKSMKLIQRRAIKL
jgi:hypothetical protein